MIGNCSSKGNGPTWKNKQNKKRLIVKMGNHFNACNWFDASISGVLSKKSPNRFKSEITNYLKIWKTALCSKLLKIEKYLGDLDISWKIIRLFHVFVSEGRIWIVLLLSWITLRNSLSNNLFFIWKDFLLNLM